VTPPQGLLSIPVRRRSRIPLLLVGSIFVGLLPVLGIYGYLKWAEIRKRPDPPIVISSPVDSPVIIPNDTQPDQLLEKAEELANKGQWKDAIALINEIPPDSLVGKKAKYFLPSHSDKIWKSAQEDYERGNLDEALEKVSYIPEGGSYGTQAKEAIANWSKEKQASDKIAEALKVSDVQTPRQLLTTIKSPGLQKQLEQKIPESEAEVLKKAQGFHDSGNLDKALDLAKKIAESSPLHPGAQGMIASWNKIIVIADFTNDWLSERLVTEADLTGKSALELDVLRNSLFAKYGLRFKDSELQKEFESQPWYQPTNISAEALPMENCLLKSGTMCEQSVLFRRKKILACLQILAVVKYVGSMRALCPLK